MSASPPSERAARHLAERYELKRQAGAGGMGSVFEATDLDSGDTVAIKILHGKNAADAARFDQEADLLAELRHPAIVRFIEHGVTAHGEKFIAMEWLQGETLDQRLRRGVLAPVHAARLAARVLDALALAHARGVVHRDIKPSNIFLVAYRVEEAKLLDFGVALRAFDPRRLTRKGATVGTPMYAAPEQARAAEDLDGRADLFSLGCVLYEALAGEPAFCADTPAAVMTKICAGEAPQILDRLPAIDLELGSLVQALMTQERAARPGDAAGLALRFAEVAQRLGAELPAGRLPPQRKPAHEALSHGEQRVMTVLALGTLARSGEFPGAPGGPADGPIPDARLARIGAIVEPYGGRIDRLLDRTLLVTAPVLGTLDEQAAQVGRMALALAAELPDLALGIGTGRGVFLARLPAGEVIEQAARLIESAAPGAVLLDALSARLLAPRFVVREAARGAGPDATPGAQLLAERGELDAPRATLTETETTFVGRERELRNLLALFEEVVTDRVARVALVTGQTGIGKTRLAAELVTRLHAAGRHPNLLRGRGLWFHGIFPYVGLHALARSAGISEDDAHDPARALDKWTAWLHAQVAVQPILLVLEDAHLCDASSLHLLDATLRRLEDQPILLLLLARPELWDRYPSLFEHRAPARLRLPTLPRRATEAMLRELLPEPAPERDAWILARARGVPYFVEELARQTARPGRLPLPESIAGVLQERFDLVGSEGKRVLRAASLYGELFDEEAVATLLPDRTPEALRQTLSLLCDAELIDRVPGVLGFEGGRYRFRDLLSREAIALTLSPGDRALGRRLARAHLDRLGLPIPVHLQAEPSRPSFTAPDLSTLIAPVGSA